MVVVQAGSWVILKDRALARDLPRLLREVETKILADAATRGNFYDGVIQKPFVEILGESTVRLLADDLPAYEEWLASHNGTLLPKQEAEKLGVWSPDLHSCSKSIIEPTKRETLQWATCYHLDITFVRSNPFKARVSLFYNKYSAGGSEDYLDLVWIPGRWILWGFETGPIS